MEILANGHFAGVNQNDPENWPNGNNQENGWIGGRYQNGHAHLPDQPRVNKNKTDLTLSSWQKILFPLILHSIHLIARYAIAFGILCIRLRKKLSSTSFIKSIFDLRNTLTIFSTRLYSIKEEVSKCSLDIGETSNFERLSYIADTTLKKKPLHVAIAILEGKNFSYNDIGNLITWCVAFNVNEITLYDINGILKNEKKQIEKILLRKVPKTIRQSHTFIWKANDALCDEDAFPTSQSYNNSDGENVKTIKDTIIVNIAAANDGPSNFEATTKFIAKNVKHNKLTMDEIDEQLIDSNLKRNLDISDPDLLIRFGLASSNMGFLPWQIRLTEIHDIYTHFDIQCWDLFEILLRYSDCEQRFGR